MSTVAPVIPTWEPIDQYLSTEEYAAKYGRSIRTVQHWCETGVLRAFRIPHFKDSQGRWWIKYIL
jgi:hypothetical protein